jgi:hypothetical protein
MPRSFLWFYDQFNPACAALNIIGKYASYGARGDPSLQKWQRQQDFA